MTNQEYLEREGTELGNGMNLFYCFTGSLVSLQIKSEDFSLPCQITLYMLDVKRPEQAAYTCLCVCVDKILRSGHAVDMHTRSHPSDHRAREDTAAVLVLDIPFSQRARFILLNSKILNKSLTLNHHLIWPAMQSVREQHHLCGLCKPLILLILGTSIKCLKGNVWNLSLYVSSCPGILCWASGHYRGANIHQYRLLMCLVHHLFVTPGSALSLLLISSTDTFFCRAGLALRRRRWGKVQCLEPPSGHWQCEPRF